MSQYRQRVDVSPSQGREIVVCPAAGLGAIGASPSALTALPEVSPTTAALALLLVVLGAATFARLQDRDRRSRSLATLALNFFFLPPVGTFTIADPQNWIALFAFLVMAVIASNLSAAAQDRARDAIARRNEVTRLFDLTRDVLLTTETAGAIDVARPSRRSTFRARQGRDLPAWRSRLAHPSGRQRRSSTWMPTPQHRPGQGTRDPRVRCPSARVWRSRARLTNGTRS